LSSDLANALIEHYGFQFMAIEAPWIRDSERFLQWPQWIWRNQDMKKWKLCKGARVYGLDLYGFFDSAEWISKRDHRFIPVAEFFEQFNGSIEAYVRYLRVFTNEADLIVSNMEKVCQEIEMDNPNLVFDLVQNVRIVRNAHRYFKSYAYGGENCWNIRESHMFDSLKHIFSKYGPNAKGIVWCHNKHVADYHATELEMNGQDSLGGLARVEFGKDHVALIGLGTFSGSVLAAKDWGSEAKVMQIPAARKNSHDDYMQKLCQELDLEEKLFWFSDSEDESFSKWRGLRGIGVLYDPLEDKRKAYVSTSMKYAFDGFACMKSTSHTVE
jgi:erythromycin esterase-like protein